MQLRERVAMGAYESEYPSDGDGHGVGFDFLTFLNCFNCSNKPPRCLRTNAVEHSAEHQDACCNHSSAVKMQL
jgi:hypothetical protein